MGDSVFPGTGGRAEQVGGGQSRRNDHQQPGQPPPPLVSAGLRHSRVSRPPSSNYDYFFGLSANGTADSEGGLSPFTVTAGALGSGFANDLVAGNGTSQTAADLGAAAVGNFTAMTNFAPPQPDPQFSAQDFQQAAYRAISQTIPTVQFPTDMFLSGAGQGAENSSVTGMPSSACFVLVPGPDGRLELIPTALAPQVSGSLDTGLYPYLTSGGSSLSTMVPGESASDGFTTIGSRSFDSLFNGAMTSNNLQQALAANQQFRTAATPMMKLGTEEGLHAPMNQPAPAPVGRHRSDPTSVVSKTSRQSGNFSNSAKQRRKTQDFDEDMSDWSSGGDPEDDPDWGSPGNSTKRNKSKSKGGSNSRNASQNSGYGNGGGTGNTKNAESRVTGRDPADEIPPRVLANTAFELFGLQPHELTPVQRQRCIDSIFERRKRNTESARKSRGRRKDYLETLENKLKELEEEKEELEQRLRELTKRVEMTNTR